MKLPDVNVLLFAVNEASAEHDEARTWRQGVYDRVIDPTELLEHHLSQTISPDIDDDH